MRETISFYLYRKKQKEKQERLPDPEGRDLCCVHLSDSDQIVDKIAGGVGLRVLLIGGVSHPNVVEAIDSDLQGVRCKVNKNLTE